MTRTTPRRVLVVQTAFLGDVILATPLLRAARQLWPEAELDFLCIPQTATLLRGNPLLRRVIPYDKRGREKGPVSFLRLARQLRARSYDLALIPHRSLRSAALAALARIPVRVGFDRSAGRKFFTHVVRYRRDRHEVERNLDLLRPFGPVPSGLRPELHPSHEDVQIVDSVQRRFRVERFVAAAPGSVWPTKRWPAAYYAELSRELRRRTGLRTVLVGGEADRPICERVEKESGGAAVSAAGQLTPLQSAELIRRAALLVTNDTAPLHMASAVGTPVVAIFGPTVPELGFGPYGVANHVAGLDLPCRPCSEHGGNKCPIGTFECMLGLKPEKVLGLVLELYDEIQATERVPAR